MIEESYLCNALKNHIFNHSNYINFNSVIRNPDNSGNFPSIIIIAMIVLIILLAGYTIFVSKK